MRRVIAVAALLICMGLTACSHPQLFPSEAMEGVDPNFDFTRWRMMPNQAAEKKIQLGGRILQSQAKTDQVTIVVAQLPIVEHPAYGPKEVGRPSSEFAITYDGKIDSLFLQGGNRVIVVGTTRAAIVVPVDDLPRSLPSVAARCVHIWNTAGKDIADFYGTGAGYEPLQEQTFCASAQ